MDFDIKASDEGRAMAVADGYRIRRPIGRKRAPLKDVPQHLRPEKKQSKVEPVVPREPIPDWLKAQLKR
jgi:hypothetical protein